MTRLLSGNLSRKALSFVIRQQPSSQRIVVAVAKEHLATIDELQAMLGFHNRGLAIRWILEQLEHQGPLSAWTLEMLTREAISTRKPMTDYSSEHWEDLYDIVDPATLRDIQAAFAEYLAGTVDWSHYLDPVPLRDRCTDRDDWFEQGMLAVLRSSSHSDEVVKAFIGELIKQSNR